MKWESFRDPSDYYATVMRCEVPGGWLVRVLSGGGESMAFLPDPEHTWDANETDAEAVPADTDDNA